MLRSEIESVHSRRSSSSHRTRWQRSSRSSGADTGTIALASASQYCFLTVIGTEGRDRTRA